MGRLRRERDRLGRHRIGEAGYQRLDADRPTATMLPLDRAVITADCETGAVGLAGAHVHGQLDCTYCTYSPEPSPRSAVLVQPQPPDGRPGREPTPRANRRIGVATSLAIWLRIVSSFSLAISRAADPSSGSTGASSMTGLLSRRETFHQPSARAQSCTPPVAQRRSRSRAHSPQPSRVTLAPITKAATATLTHSQRLMRMGCGCPFCKRPIRSSTVALSSEVRRLFN